MLDDAVVASVLLLFLATAVERGVETLLAAAGGFLPAGSDTRKAVAIVLAMALGSGIAFGLEMDLVRPLLGGGLSATQGRALTAIAPGGGSAPAHELLRLLEEAKGRLKAPDNDVNKSRLTGDAFRK